MSRQVTRKPDATDAKQTVLSGGLPADGAEDESADPVGDGRSDGDLAASLPATKSSKRQSSKGLELPRSVKRG